MATIFPSTPSVGDTYQGYEWNGTAWVIIGINLTTDYLTPTELETYLNGNIDTHMIPNGNEVYDLGEPENKFRDLYLSSSTIHLGDAAISSDGTDINIDGYIRSENSMVVIDNGEDANYERPNNVGAVYWIGSVQPINAAPHDIWKNG